ncbi:radical SAM (seleno)protein TrsS [Clostridium coskatii]|uniref:Cyclic pyranopterin monophosphate synthase 1 n=1 Tax=Clostridium coskatii TaxID=1705578 RepID=A0A162J8M8_9CLOT|nr:radical SAM (seleno)protein TrsS [Clostridium coskatii]OAA91875.1 Cyclic pyranopterin monophosphate synthase 1 [Clostridium coskatii]OBR91084.1 cyclic pyranopterin monophosphate synthase 1 [Clostridium coskatii]
MKSVDIISETQSLCPICLKKIDAKKVLDVNKVYMEKYCPDHGQFKTILWKGNISMKKWIRNKERAYIKNPSTNVQKGCPFDCGLCSEHRQHTCTALIEVTQRCNLKCKFCFADSYAGKEKDISIEKIKFMYKKLLESSGSCNVQLSGGEPTIRDDLPDIVKLGRKLGFKFIQVNTNGIRMAQDEEYVKKLKISGLSSIFLQFDGTTDLIYRKLRGAELLNLKVKAIENCRKHNIGVVLVPTIVPGINEDNIGEIINFGLNNMPAVRGVHFQPVSYFGRVPFIPKEEQRITLPEIIENIEKQTLGKFKIESMKPPGCENALCSFHGNYIYKDKKELINVTNNSKSCCSKNEKAEEGARKAKEFVSRNWSSRKVTNPNTKVKSSKIDSWDKILYNINNYSFSISGMAFQDIWNVDLERVKDCCIHVVSEEGKLIPFCMYNITDAGGNYIYRNCKVKMKMTSLEA